MSSLSLDCGGAQQISETSSRILHSRTVQFETARYLSLLQDAETGQRGYILTENVDFLEPYKEALPQISVSLDSLKSLIADNPRQVTNAARLEAPTKEKLAEMHSVILLLEGGDREASVVRIKSGAGKRLMDEIRKIIDDIGDEETRLIAARQAEENRILLWVRSAEVVGILILLISSMVVMRQTANVFAAQRIANENKAAAAAAAESANRSKSEFLASMSHEIRTPLNGIVANLELLAQTDLQHAQIEMLDDADKAAKSLLALIGNILDFSKIEAGKLAIELADVKIDALLNQTTDILQSKARQKGLFISTSIDPGVPDIVYGDPARLRQILLNLVGNSIKFTQHGGVHVRIDVSGWSDNVCLLEFAVHDSGMGFEQAQAEQLFETFKQAAQINTLAQEQGSGLGLSICRSLIETFGGKMWAEGAPGKGATFRMTLPAKCIARAPAPPRADLSGRAVLVIGSGAFVDSPLVSYFKARGAQIERCATLNEAVEACIQAEAGERHYDIALIESLDENINRNRECLRLLRLYHTVPLVVGDVSSAVAWHQALGVGAAAVIATDVDEPWLDRNIVTLNGAAAKLGRKFMSASEKNAPLHDFGGAHVLVLEDRLVNQTVIQRQLKRLNISCTIGNDGHQGLQRLRTRAFDLVLADCSMPNMDGFAFTREVRRLEQETGDGKHLPIIAITANAFREDAEKCFAAGMDDFLSKPVTLDRLSAALERWLKPRAAGAVSEAVVVQPSQTDEDAPVDVTALGELLGTADPAVLSEVFRDFAVAARSSFEEVKMCVEQGDAASLASAAHGAKGEARNAATRCLGELYAKLEARARAGRVEPGSALLEDIEAELEKVESFISAFSEKAS